MAGKLESRGLLAIIGMVCGAKQTVGRDSEAERATGQQVLVGLRTRTEFRLRHPGRPLPPVLERLFLSTFSQHIDSAGAPSVAKSSKMSTDKAAAAAAAIDHGALFHSTAEDKARMSVVVSALAEKLSRAMMISADDLDPDRRSRRMESID